MFEHTPGPWRFNAILTASENHRGWNISRDHAGFGGYIGTVSPKIKDDRGCASAEGLANARLIASAPQMLEALIDCRRALELANFTGELAVVDAAIAKATGEQS